MPADVTLLLLVLMGRLFGVNLDGEIIRKMVHQVICGITGLHNYGKLGHFPTHSALTRDKPTHHLVYCEIWHALTGTGPIHKGWRMMMVQGTALFPDQTFLEDALNMACQSVLVQYGVLDASGSAEWEELVKNLLHLMLCALILSPGQINGHISSITETHVAESAILIRSKIVKIIII
ncbi:hypothetical protein BJY52DRAFT_1228303 [Lactarius psammicola]|nr:hypothetical protein BJY52DRAFT_1228303 [Lactarius psammicola]